MHLTRRDFLKGAAALGAGALAIPVLADETGLVAERPTFVVPGLDPRHDGLRVAQLSDLHVGDRTPRQRIRAAITAANDFAPDLVVLTGDYLSRDRSGVQLMREQLGGLRAPTVAVLGNHDVRVHPEGAAAALATHGYDLLRNQHTVVRLRGAPLAVVGVDDLMTRQADPARALAGVPAGSRLVLAHGPRTADLLRGAGEPMLVLSGHTHGGQVNLPGLTSFLLRSVLREPYDQGHFRLGDVQLYVNRGVGNSGVRLRINSDPEVTLATLRSAEVVEAG